MKSRFTSVVRLLLMGSVVGLAPIAIGCSDEKAATGEQASPDIRANLEASTKAAAEVAKEKKTAK